MKSLVFYIIVLLSLSSYGQLSFSNDTIKIKEILVSGRRELSGSAGYKSTFIDSTILRDYSYGNLAEIIAENSTVFIKSHGLGGIASTSFSGTGASHTQVAWNEVNINSPMLGQTDLALIPAGFIDEIQVLHGGASLALNKAFIVVNNSGKIEVTDKNSMRSLKTINGLISPRNILFINNNEKTYVSSFYSDSLTIINSNNYSISGYINIRRSSEVMLMFDDKAFISNWSSGKEIMVINTVTNKVIDSIKVAIGPESMVLDKNNMLWVLCDGGYTGQNSAELISINTDNIKIDRRFVFLSKNSAPSCLQINSRGDTLYYIDKDIWRMGITALTLPNQPFILTSVRMFYKMGINPENSGIFLTDAVDYKQKGYVARFKSNGDLIAPYRADIIPGSFCFK